MQFCENRKTASHKRNSTTNARKGLEYVEMSKSIVSIIIPTKDEGQGIKSVIASVKKYSDEIIIVDANSNDGTKEAAIKNHARFYLDSGLGKGEAVRIGVKRAKGDIVIIFDSDGSPNPSDIPRIIKEIKNGADVAITSRRTGGSFDFELSPSGILRTFGSDLMAYLVNLKFKSNFSDVIYNFRGFRKSVLNKLDLQANGFDVEQEMLVKSLQGNFKVVEIPSRENARKWGKSKLHTLMGISLLYKLLKLLYF